MTAYQNPTTLNSPSTYSNAYTVSSSCAYYSEPTVPHRFNTAGATADENISPTPTTDGVDGKDYECTKLPEYMQGILDQGGLIASLNKD